MSIQRTNIKELFDNQVIIEKLYEEVKRLTELHNDFLHSKGESLDTIISNDENVKNMSKRMTIKGIVRVFLFLGATVLNMFGFLSELIYIILIILLIISVGKNNKGLNDLINSIKEKRPKQKAADAAIYDELCEKRSLYQEMIKEQESIVNQLSDEEYQEFLELLNEYSDKKYQEYLKLLDEYSQVLDRIMETYGKTKEEHAPVSVETPKKRNLFSTLFANKSKMQ